MGTSHNPICSKPLGLLVGAVVLAAMGCGGDEKKTAQPSTASDREGLPQSSEPAHQDPAEFTTTIDNRWWPMPSGKRWRYRETDEEGTKQDVVVTVTDRTKKIANGVTAGVVRDTVSEHGHIIEDTFDWYAQDKSGTVWYVGEDTAEWLGLS